MQNLTLNYLELRLSNVANTSKFVNNYHSRDNLYSTLLFDALYTILTLCINCGLFLNNLVKLVKVFVLFFCYILPFW